MMGSYEIPEFSRKQNEALYKLLQQTFTRLERKIEDLGRRGVTLTPLKQVPKRNQGSLGAAVMVQLATERFLYLKFEDGWHSIRIPGGIIPPKEDTGHEAEEVPS